MHQNSSPFSPHITPPTPPTGSSILSPPSKNLVGCFYICTVLFKILVTFFAMFMMCWWQFAWLKSNSKCTLCGWKVRVGLKTLMNDIIIDAFFEPSYFFLAQTARICAHHVTENERLKKWFKGLLMDSSFLSIFPLFPKQLLLFLLIPVHQ